MYGTRKGRIKRDLGAFLLRHSTLATRFSGFLSRICGPRLCGFSCAWLSSPNEYWRPLVRRPLKSHEKVTNLTVWSCTSQSSLYVPYRIPSQLDHATLLTVCDQMCFGARFPFFSSNFFLAILFNTIHAQRHAAMPWDVTEDKFSMQLVLPAQENVCFLPSRLSPSISNQPCLVFDVFAIRNWALLSFIFFLRTYKGLRGMVRLSVSSDISRTSFLCAFPFLPQTQISSPLSLPRLYLRSMQSFFFRIFLGFHRSNLARPVGARPSRGY